MAEGTGTAPETHAHFDAGFLKQKVGPLPLWVWLAAGLAIWYVLNRQTSQAAGDTAAPDPSIDPSTGELWATEFGAAQQQLQDAQSGQTGIAGGFANDKAWATAAVNYLVGLGIDATEASNAVNKYIGNQALTAKEQADVNLAIQGIGAPPTVHTTTGPGDGTGGPGPGGGGSGSKPSNAPGGLTASKVTTNSARLDWGPLANATSYRVRVWAGNKALDKTSKDSHEAFSGLTPGRKYNAHVAGVNSHGQGPWSETVTFTTHKVVTSRSRT